ncbi:CRISPR-associated endonuclease Cas1 [Desulfurococcaceae archaeon AG1]|nr:CRISPR-associated endonuclease Cas1 [Desulfurococcaceae archaeon AG1]
MRTLVVSEYGVKISAKNGSLVIATKNKKIRVSPADIDQILIITGGASITSRAVRLAITHGIDIVFINTRGEPWARIYMPTPTATTSSRRAQYEAIYNGDAREIARSIVEAKLKNQAGLLKSLKRKGYIEGTPHREIELLIPQLDTEDPVKVEAEAAHIYWQSIAQALPKSIGFEGRNHDSPDPFNLSLNYSYAILYSECWKALVIAGLDPYAGYIHKDRSGKESLVYDFSEMFKPSVVDRALIEIFRRGYRPRISEGLIERADRAELAKAVAESLERVVREEGDHNPKKLSQALRAAAIRLASSLRERTRYRGFVEVW